MLVGLDLTGLEVPQRSRAAHCPLELASALKLDLLILDIKVPILDGISAVERIAAGQIAPGGGPDRHLSAEDPSGTS